MAAAYPEDVPAEESMESLHSRLKASLFDMLNSKCLFQEFKTHLIDEFDIDRRRASDIHSFGDLLEELESLFLLYVDEDHCALAGIDRLMNVLSISLEDHEVKHILDTIKHRAEKARPQPATPPHLVITPLTLEEEAVIVQQLEPMHGYLHQVISNLGYGLTSNSDLNESVTLLQVDIDAYSSQRVAIGLNRALLDFQRRILAQEAEFLNLNITTISMRDYLLRLFVDGNYFHCPLKRLVRELKKVSS